MKPRAPSPPRERRRNPAADSASAESVDTPLGSQSLATPPIDPLVEPTGHYGPGYGDDRRVDPAKPDMRRRRKDDDKPGS